MYLDANNLYGWAMTDTGYLLELDTEYPKELHSSHRDLPLLPIK